jgi:hypothetical protein
VGSPTVGGRSVALVLLSFARIHRAGAGHSGGYAELRPQIKLEEQPQGQQGDQREEVHGVLEIRSLGKVSGSREPATGSQ